jgi:hypothetical protein
MQPIAFKRLKSNQISRIVEGTQDAAVTRQTPDLAVLSFAFLPSSPSRSYAERPMGTNPALTPNPSSYKSNPGIRFPFKISWAAQNSLHGGPLLV